MQFLKVRIGAAILICIAALSCFLVFAIPNSSNQLTSTGTVYAGDFIDIDKTSINWGTLYPDSTATATLTVTSKVDFNLSLSLISDNWNPVNTWQYITLSWNYSGAALSSYASIPLLLTLKVNPSITGITGFSFTITVTSNQS